MGDCVVEISPDGSLTGVGANTDVVSVADGGKEAPPGPSYVVCEDDNDFMMPPPVCRGTRSAAINRPTNDDVVVFSNKRAVERPFKLRCSIEKLKPHKFRLLDEARKIKGHVLSNDFRAKYRE